MRLQRDRAVGSCAFSAIGADQYAITQETPAWCQQPMQLGRQRNAISQYRADRAEDATTSDRAEDATTSDRAEGATTSDRAEGATTNDRAEGATTNDRDSTGIDF